jgi:DNA-binding TFAR19-related protein (PDSD5 family)
MIPMSDKELEALKQKRLQEMQKRMARQEYKKETKEQVDSSQILDKIFRGRAWEVFNAAKTQFPSLMPEIERLLVSLALERNIGEVEGEQLLALLREIGLQVRLNTTIKVLSRGKIKSLSEKFRESTMQK